MFLEIDNNVELSKKYSKYELVSLAFLLLKNEKREMEKYGTKIIISDLLEEVIKKLSNNEYSKEQIDEIFVQEKI